MNRKEAEQILEQAYSSEIGYHWRKKEADEYFIKLKRKKNGMHGWLFKWRFKENE